MQFVKGEPRRLLKRLRLQSLMSQIDVCIALGVKMNQTRYSYIERGYLNPTGDEAEALIELFPDLPKDYFEGHETEKGA